MVKRVLIGTFIVILAINLISSFLHTKFKEFTDQYGDIGLTFAYPSNWKITVIEPMLFFEKKCPIYLQWQACPILSVVRSKNNSNIGYSLSDVDSVDLLKDKNYILRNETVSKIERMKIDGIDAIYFDSIDNLGNIGIGTAKVKRSYIFFKDDYHYSIDYSEPIYIGSLSVPEKAEDWKYYDALQTMVSSIKFK